MYKRLSAVMFPLVTILFIGAIYWGYQEHHEKNTILLKSENQYQRAFGDLTYYVGQLHDQLGNTLAVNSTSREYHRKGLVNVWRLTGEAQNQISQLPLSYLPFNDTEQFLSKVSNFAYKTAVRDLTKEPLNDEEFTVLNTLYANSGEISSQLTKLQQDIMNSQLRWMDVEIAIAADEAEVNHPVVSSLRNMNSDVVEYPELNWGPAVNSMYTDHTLSILSGEPITEADVKDMAAKFTGKDTNSIEVVENGKDSDFATYTAIVKEGNDDKKDMKLTYAAKGGKLISYVHTRETSETKLKVEEAKKKAEKFLTDHEYENMEAVSFDEYYHTGSFVFVYAENDTLIYPDKVTVKIAMDDGEIIGFQASEFFSHHKQREIKQAGIDIDRAKAALNPSLKVERHRMAIIKGELGSEVLCYEFTGKINDQNYRIYINADSGLEETIEKMSLADKKASK